MLRRLAAPLPLLLTLTPSLAHATPWKPRAGVTVPGDVALVAQDVEVADVNADGFPDLVFAHSAGDSTGSDATAQTPQIVANIAGAGFAEFVALPAPHNAFDVAAGDLDGDGDLDLVFAVNFGGASHVLINDNLNFVAVPTLQLNGVNVGAVALGDVNADGLLDAVYASWGFSSPFGAGGDLGGPLLLGFGAGDGNFGFAEGFIPAQAGDLLSWSFDVDLVDLDNDRDLDLIAASRGPGPARVFLNSGDGHFTQLDQPALADRPVDLAFTPIDMNFDGNVDVIGLQNGSLAGACTDVDGVSLCGQNNTILFGDGTGALQDLTDMFLFQPANEPRLDFDAAVLDFNNDGLPDVVFAGLRQSDVEANGRLLVSDGVGLGQPENPPVVAFPQVPETARVAAVGVGDFDLDRREDLVLAARDATQPSVVVFGDADPADGVPLDAVPPALINHDVFIEPHFGDLVTLRVRSHDHKSPVAWHHFQFDPDVALKVIPGAATAHKRRLPYVELALGLLNSAEILDIPDGDPKKTIVPGVWYGESMWRFDVPLPFGGVLTDKITYQYCAIDAAGNKACIGPLSAGIGVDPTDCGNGQVEPWEQCDDAIDFNCSACVFSCGDGQCQMNEDFNTCPEDCGFCGDGLCQPPGESSDTCLEDCGFCGDGICIFPEDVDSCPDDCGNSFCGDLICEFDEVEQCIADCPCDFDLVCDFDEDAFTCPFDCDNGVICGDGLCQGEEEVTCPEDCFGCNFDGFCDFDEDASTCPSDCSNVEPFCGDGVCDPGLGEDFQNCAIDCPPPPCGDGVCGLNETITSCPIDCAVGPCGDGVCDPDTEENATCPLDCLAECGNDVCELNEDCPEDCDDEMCEDGSERVDGACQGAEDGGCGCTSDARPDPLALLGLGLGLAGRRRRRRV